MMNKQYNRYDIHNHTRYSNLRLRDALPTPEDLIDEAIKMGLKGINISDHETLSGHIKANQYAQKIKEEYPDFKVTLGNEIYLVDERPNNDHYHFVLTCIDAEGHHQLRELSSIAWLNNYNSTLMRVDTLKEDLERIVLKRPGHLIGSTACIGSELGKSILAMTAAEKNNDKMTAKFYHDKIVNFILWGKKVFGNNFYIEVQPGVSREQIIVNQRLLSISQCFNIKMIPSSDSHYLRPEHRYVHKAFLNSDGNKEREVDAFYQDAYLHTNEEMIEKFKKSGYDELFIEQLFENSMEVYNKIEDFSLGHSQQVPKVPIPQIAKKESPKNLIKYKTLSKMYQSDDNIDRYWINTCIDKLIKINKFNDTYLSELEEEAEVKYIVGKKLDTNMFSYPIALAHYIKLIWDCDSTVGVGRGSACAALNHYLLGITQLDPIEWNFPFFRYMNRDTEGLGDIDIDVCASKVQTILAKIREERGKSFSPEITDSLIRKSLGAVYVCTFGTETSKSAIQTAARGYRSEDFPNGIDVDIAQYLSSLIPSERGFVWSIHDTVYGNEEKGRKPIAAFVNEIKQYPGLLEIALGIEGCISRRGRHASGVLFTGEDPFEFNAYMVTPGGEIVTQYDLHDAEWAGSTKMDILVTEVQDKIAQTIKFLQQANIINPELSLKEAYDEYLHPDVLPYKSDKETWKVIQNASSLDLFQLDSDIGRLGAKKVKPANMIELSATNGLIRLMTTEKGAETWLDKFVRFKNNPNDLEEEISSYCLSETEKESLKKYLGETFGIGISQEQMMKVLMDENLCNFSLKEANRARKIVSKKKMKEIPFFKEQVFSHAATPNVARYIWNYVVGPGLGYSFSDIHSISYSFIGFQTAYLATHWNPIYWDTACLVVNSGSLEEGSNIGDDDEDDISAIKKDKNSDYTKIAKAIGSIASNGINISLVNINTSGYGFQPDVENNRILYGLKALSGINDDIIDNILKNRPYKGIKDFLMRCRLGKKPMISLIKAGAFDEIDKDFNSREEIMAYYIYQISEPKKNINLQNFNGLITANLIPEKFNIQIRVYNFNKYLKANCKKGKYYNFDDQCQLFFNKFLKDYIDKLEVIEETICIEQKIWDNIYQGYMNTIRKWMKEEQKQIIDNYNTYLFLNLWNKYAKGNLSHWEMEALCFYYSKHELAEVDTKIYGIENFFNLAEQPVVDYYFRRKEIQIPIFKCSRIIGTVIAKNDNRSSISLLTPNGVVNVKFTRDYYSMFKKQISQIQPDGKKKVIEKGWFGRGNMLMITGYRRDDSFVAKTYKSMHTHQLYHIDEVVGDRIKIRHERFTVDNSFEEDIDE